MNNSGVISQLDADDSLSSGWVEAQGSNWGSDSLSIGVDGDNRVSLF